MAKRAEISWKEAQKINYLKEAKQKHKTFEVRSWIIAENAEKVKVSQKKLNEY